MAPGDPLRVTKEGLVLLVHVQPGARREGAGPLHDGRLRVRVSAPPEGGRANARVEEMIAELFGVARRDVAVVAGASSRRKDVALGGLDAAAARARLDSLLAGPDA